MLGVRKPWLQINSSVRRARSKPPPVTVEVVEILGTQGQQGLGILRSGSLPNVAAPQVPKTETELENQKVPNSQNPFLIFSYSGLTLLVTAGNYQ